MVRERLRRYASMTKKYELLTGNCSKHRRSEGVHIANVQEWLAIANVSTTRLYERRKSKLEIANFKKILFTLICAVAGSRRRGLRYADSPSTILFPVFGSLLLSPRFVSSFESPGDVSPQTRQLPFPPVASVYLLSFSASRCNDADCYILELVNRQVGKHIFTGTSSGLSIPNETRIGAENR